MTGSGAGNKQLRIGETEVAYTDPGRRRRRAPAHA